MQLAEKVIIVTGSTTGIGEAVARRCVAEGARVLLHGRDRQRGEQLCQELGSAAALHIDDLADPASPGRLVSAAVDAFGRIDGLVNNAAWTGRDTLDTVSPESFDQAMAINVRAPLLLIRAALPHLRQAGGSVVNIGSVNAYTGETVLLIYSLTKGALMTLSRNLANTLAGSGVRINHFNVGWVLTPNEYQVKIADGLPADWPARVAPADVPTGTLTRPEQIAAHVAFWLSEQSAPITGSVIDLEQFPIVGRAAPKEMR